MSKAILIIDEPNKCAECPLYDHTFWSCNYTGSKKDINIDKLSDCPLRPMGLRTRTSGYVLYSTEFLKKHLDREYELWKELKKYNFGKADKE